MIQGTFVSICLCLIFIAAKWTFNSSIETICKWKKLLRNFFRCLSKTVLMICLQQETNLFNLLLAKSRNFGIYFLGKFYVCEMKLLDYSYSPIFTLFYTYEAHILHRLGVSWCLVSDTYRVRYWHDDTYEYIELCHFLKLLLVLMCPCRVRCPCLINVHLYWSWWSLF